MFFQTLVLFCSVITYMERHNIIYLFLNFDLRVLIRIGTLPLLLLPPLLPPQQKDTEIASVQKHYLIQSFLKRFGTRMFLKE